MGLLKYTPYDHAIPRDPLWELISVTLQTPRSEELVISFLKTMRHRGDNIGGNHREGDNERIEI